MNFLEQAIDNAHTLKATAKHAAGKYLEENREEVKQAVKVATKVTIYGAIAYTAYEILLG